MLSPPTPLLDDVPNTRWRGDDGAALVEAAFVLPVLLMILLGILEMGLLMKDYQAAENATQAAGRMASVEGADIDADYAILQAVRKGGIAITQADVNRIVVFRAAGATSTVPTNCRTSGTGIASPDFCNVYFSSDFTRPQAQFDCSAGSPYVNTSPSRFWCPNTRKTAALATNGNGPPDWLGVYLNMTHKWTTKLFRTTSILEETTIVKLEPDRRL